MTQLSLRLPDELHQKLKAAAEHNRRSLHAEILWRLEHDQEPGRTLAGREAAQPAAS